MNSPMLIYETDSRLGVPKLQAINGAGKTWTAKDLCQLEEQLRPRYDVLVREGKGTIIFKGKTLFIQKKDGDESRQPTLELRSYEWSAPPFPEKPVAMPPLPSPLGGDWGKGFLAEIDRLFASDRFRVVLPPEKAMLDLIRKELSSLIDKSPPSDLALLMLVSILRTAEQVSRTQRPDEPRPYAYALSGIERLMSEKAEATQTPWGKLPSEPINDPPPSRLVRFWQRMMGT